ncbi:MAG: DegV family protein [Anaerolineales bacterium]|nr:DegV family protein [Anaerolineales bacterium]
MTKIALVTDSTAYIPKDYIKQYNITVTPLVLIWGDETFEDGVDIQPDEFYSRLQTAEVMPSTSQTTPATMQKTFAALLDKGYEIVALFISSKLSGTVQSAVQAKEAFSAGKEKIHIIDTFSTAMAMGYQVLAVARAISDGADIDDCLSLAEKARNNTGVYFAVDTLEFLHRGGRIGGAQRFLGSALNLKPILALQDGRVVAVDRVRTKRKAIDRVQELVAAQVNGKSSIRLATIHANAKDEAKQLLERASNDLGAIESVRSEVSPVIGTHAGPGTVGLAYMYDVS